MFSTDSSFLNGYDSYILGNRKVPANVDPVLWQQGYEAAKRLDTEQKFKDENDEFWLMMQE
jgi:hypothetical protein